MATQQTPAVSERALQLLEIIAKAEQPPTLNDLTSRIELPKATTHRFVALLEKLGFAQRTLDGRHYQVGHRLTGRGVISRSNGNGSLQRLAAGSRVRRMGAIVLNRVEEHALRAAQRPDRLETAVADAVVNRPAGNAEKFCGMVQRDAATDTSLGARFRTALSHHHPLSSGCTQ